ncbi:MAG: redoxin domain-containing protein [Gammaproteobacteria bacterium]|nr:redoxin domain-containing protein [Gammaproteobacteria bacterium]
MKLTQRIAIAIVVSLGLVAAAHAAPTKTKYSTIDLVAEQASLPVNGGSISIGFFIEPDVTWHAYWKNPGDAGMEPSIAWELPEGFSVGAFEFPTPHLLPFGDLNTYGYEEPILLTATVTVPDGLSAGQSIDFAGKARWVVCDDNVCVPERMDVLLTLDVGDARANPTTAELFATARSKVPADVDWPAEFEVRDDKVTIQISPPDLPSSLEDAYLFVESRNLVGYGTQSAGFTRAGMSFVMDAARNASDEDKGRAVLSFTDADGDHRAVALDLAKASGPLAAAADPQVVAAGGGVGFWEAAFYAFLGGLILNLMPCVFPILSMKALSLVNLAKQDQRAARESGLVYTLGVLVAFAAIGFAILGFRAAGNAVYWGFQFQNGPVNMLVAMIMVVIGLNLLGVFEVGTRMMGVGQELTQGGERRAAFFTGVLAVVVATPCGAPFMATAIGFAFQQTSATLVTIFLALGFGLAFPYLLLSFVPDIGKKLPKPGQWMETFKHFLAFPMFLAALYFFWVGGRVLGVSSMFAGLVTALALSFTLWAYGKGAMARKKGVWIAAALLGLLATGYVFTKIDSSKVVLDEDGQAVAGTLGGLELEHFDEDQVKQYIADGQPVFVYFTADWCISCKANERVALATDTVAEAFNSRGIKVIEGDWTLEDPVITEWLERYDRAGVPLYLYFPRGSSLDTVTILPQILTPGLVIDAIVAADEVAEELPVVATQSDEEVTDEDAELAEYINFEVPDAEPDWAPVQTYIDADAVWHEIDDAIRSSDASSDEKERRQDEERGPHPEILDAQAAATAIVKLDGAHEKTYDAALFLIEHTRGAPGGVRSILLGLHTMTAHGEDFDGWPAALFNLDFAAPVGWFPEVDNYFEDYEFYVPDDALVRATAQYYAASRQMRFANAVDTAAADRPAYKQRGLELATGLSKGVEDEELVKRRRYTDDGEPIPFPTMAEAEEDLLYNLNFLTVGDKIPDVNGARLDGGAESIAEFEGETVLLDFWATWCGPCIRAIPKMVELDSELPEDEFEILSISVDEKIETVTEFHKTKPMPWAHWHVGPEADLLQTWAVRGYPTYILVDHNGTIVARQHDLNKNFMALIRDTACGPTGGGNC